MKVAGLAVWGVALRRTKLTDEQVPLSLSTLASALPPEQGTIGPEQNSSACSVPFRNKWNRWNKNHDLFFVDNIAHQWLKTIVSVFSFFHF